MTECSGYENNIAAMLMQRRDKAGPERVNRQNRSYPGSSSPLLESSLMPCYDRRVNRRFHTFVSVAAILLMAVSQVCGLFDRWDTIADVGHDSEFMFLVIGMCIGLCLLMALLLVQLVRTVFLLVMRLLRAASPPAQPHSYGCDYLLLLFSPPLSFTSLRI
jgi:hypothetical protein